MKKQVITLAASALIACPMLIFAQPVPLSVNHTAGGVGMRIAHGGITNGPGLLQGFAHNDVLLGNFLEGGAYGHGFISIGHTPDSGRTFSIGSASDSTFTAATFVPHLSVTGNGYVGIGTNKPGAVLDVVGHMVTRGRKTGYGIASTNGLAWGWYRREDVGGTNDDLKLLRYVNGGYSDIAMQVQNATGNIGMGTTSPRGKLDVNGDAYIRNGIDVAGGAWVHGNIRVDGAADLRGSAQIGNFAFGTDAGGQNYPYEWESIGLINGQNNFRLQSPASFLVHTGPNFDARMWIDSAGNTIFNGKVSVTTLELTSDRNQKQDARPVSAAEILAKVTALPVSTWAYTNSPNVHHLGPMAQDFKAAFNLGDDDKHISAGDGIGVALAAIKGLHELVQEKNSEIAALKRELAGMKQELAIVKDSVTDRLAALEKATAKNVEQASNTLPHPDLTILEKKTAHVAASAEATR